MAMAIIIFYRKITIKKTRRLVILSILSTLDLYKSTGTFYYFIKIMYNLILTFTCIMIVHNVSLV